MNYAPFNDYIEMMKRKIWVNRAFGVGYGFKHFFNSGCLAFLARGVYIGWAGSLLNIYSRMYFSFHFCLYLTLGTLFFLGGGMAKETNNLQIPSSLPSHDSCVKPSLFRSAVSHKWLYTT
jgi:hypothetical protein